MIAGCMLYQEQPGLVYEAGAIYPYKQTRMQPLKMASMFPLLKDWMSSILMTYRQIMRGGGSALLMSLL